MEARSNISSGPRSTHRFSSWQTRDSRSICRQDRRSSGRGGPLSSASLIESAEFMQPRPEPATDIETPNSDGYTSIRTRSAFAGSMVPGVGSQFQTVPPNLYLPKEIELASRSSLNQHLRKPNPSAMSKSQDPGACTRCVKDNHECSRQASTLHKQPTKCWRCSTFDYTCELPSELDNVPQKASATKPMTLRSQSNRSIPAPKPILMAARHERLQHVAVNAQPPDGSHLGDVSATECTARLIASQEGQSLPATYESDVLSLTKRLFELAIPHCSHHEKPCPLSTGLSMRVGAPVKQIPVSGAIVGSSGFGGIASTRNASSPYTQQTSQQPPGSDPESEQEEPSDGEDGHPPQDGEDSLEGTRRRTLACPYVQNSQYFHDHPECRRCLAAILRNMTAVDQHMRRTHHYCVKCRRQFQSPETFRNHIPKDRHCKKCHDIFQTARELGEHKSKRCHKRDKRSDKEKWYAMFRSLFPEAVRPASYHADYIPTFQDDSQLADWVRALPWGCKMYIRHLFEQHDIVGNTATPRELEILDRALGPAPGPAPMNGFDMSWNAPGGFQQDMTIFGPTINLAGTSPVSYTDTSFSSITSQASSPPHQTFNHSQQGGSIPQMQPQYVGQPISAQNRLHSSTSIPSTQQSFPASQNEVYNPWSHQTHSASQPQPQFGQYGNTLSPDHAYTHSRGMPRATGQHVNYPYHSTSFGQPPTSSTYPTTPTALHLQTPRNLASASTSLTPNFCQSHTATAPDQSMSERNSANNRNYYSQT